MRGKDVPRIVHVSNQRITPAYAGKSKSRRWEDFVKRDHPRLCGEKPVSIYVCSIGKGSPPPMRGKVIELEEKKDE